MLDLSVAVGQQRAAARAGDAEPSGCRTRERPSAPSSARTSSGCCRASSPRTRAATGRPPRRSCARTSASRCRRTRWCYDGRDAMRPLLERVGRRRWASGGSCPTRANRHAGGGLLPAPAGRHGFRAFKLDVLRCARRADRRDHDVRHRVVRPRSASPMNWRMWHGLNPHVQGHEGFQRLRGADIAAARTFYGDTLGIDVTEEHGMLTLRLAGGRDHVDLPEAEPRAGDLHHPQLPRRRHRQRRRRVARAGRGHSRSTTASTRTSAGSSRDDGGPPIAWFRDPAGNILSVMELES